MEINELLKELSMPYSSLCDYLIYKYGAAQYDYFCNPTCRSKQPKVKRTNEGLICHHIREDMGANLSNKDTALLQPYNWQKKEVLLYCNELEHLVLHYKIAVMRQKTRLLEPAAIYSFFSHSGIYMICHGINDCFMQNGTDVPWKQRCFEKYSENYSVYIALLKALLCYLISQYDGIKNPRRIRIGSKVQCCDGIGIIEKIEDNRNTLVVKFPNEQRNTYPVEEFLSQLSFADYLDRVSIRMCSGYKGFIKAVFDDLNSCNDPLVDLIVDSLSVDFRGYGFPQFSNHPLDKSVFGSLSIDEYLSKAVPSYTHKELELGNSPPLFWTGEIPRFVLDETLFFVLRFETSFSLIDGEEPFVRYKDLTDLLRISFSKLLEKNDDNNFLKKNGLIITTSDVYDPNTQKYYQQYIGNDGAIKNATVILTMDKDDFELFKTRHSVRSLVVLDGCYFPKETS